MNRKLPIMLTAICLGVALPGCSREEPPREPEQVLSGDNPFKPLVDSHTKAGTVEAQVLEQAAGTRRAVDQQAR